MTLRVKRRGPWYQSAAGEIKTINNVVVTGTTFATSTVAAFDGTSSKVALGQRGPSSEPGISLGNADDCVFSRVASGRVHFAAGSTNGFDLAVGTYAGGTAVGGVLSFGTGAPVDASGANGDVYIRKDGGALTTIYQRRAGAWVGVI